MPALRHAKIALRAIFSGLRRLAFSPGPYRAYFWISVARHAATTPFAPFAAYHLKSVAALCAWALRRRIDHAGARPFLLLSLALLAGLALIAALARLPEPDAPPLDPLFPGYLLLRPHRAVFYPINLVDPRK